uniref:Uncharacterized protein n=1 Tax=Monodelphis domestica TaxID=13616 RepID=A0A5F8G8N6_MONDO
MKKPPQIVAKREQMIIQIQSPKKGGKDITEEIMPDAKTQPSPPTPP